MRRPDPTAPSLARILAPEAARPATWRIAAALALVAACGDGDRAAGPQSGPPGEAPVAEPTDARRPAPPPSNPTGDAEAPADVGASARDPVDRPGAASPERQDAAGADAGPRAHLDPGSEGDGDFVADPPYALPPSSTMRDPGAPAGKVTKHAIVSKVLGDKSYDYWLYVPAQYDGSRPVPSMVIMDGDLYVDGYGMPAMNRYPMAILLDNLIARGDIPAMIVVFAKFRNRPLEYDAIDDRWSQFVIGELLPLVEQTYRLDDDPEGRATAGHSSGGSAAFTLAWRHPEVFRRVMTHNGSFTALRGADQYPALIRSTPRKPLRVILLSGSMDLSFGPNMDWPEANRKMAAALKAQGYHYQFYFGNGARHDSFYPSMTMPASLKWLWRGYVAP